MNAEISRRALLAASAGALTAAAPGRRSPLTTAALWGMTLVQTGRYLALAQRSGAGFNRLHLNETLATPASTLAAPNVDTIYGYAWLDLAREPVLLSVPDAGDRYYSVQFIDAYQNIIAYVGHRETGTRAGSYAIVGPGWSGTLPAGVARIDAPTALVLALTRTLVRGTADLGAAQAFQRRYALAPLSAGARGQPPLVQSEALNAFPMLDLAGDGDPYFRELDALVRRYPPRGRETEVFATLAPLGLGRAFPPDGAPRSALQAALDGAIAAVKRTDLTENNNGWRVNYHIARFNADPLARAVINRVGPGAHAAEEALYFRGAADSTGAPLDGAQRYRIVFARNGLPPARAFWSLILYGADLRLVANPLNRYTINDRTENLRFAADGSLPITVAHEDPRDGTNWLPAPRGPFSLLLRTYEPDASLRSGAYRVPSITRVT